MNASHAQCPNCGTRFTAGEHRARSNLAAALLWEAPKSLELQLDESVLVTCPNCSTSFRSDAVRLLGFLTPRQFKVLLTVFVAAFLAAVVYSGFLS